MTVAQGWVIIKSQSTNEGNNTVQTFFLIILLTIGMVSCMNNALQHQATKEAVVAKKTQSKTIIIRETVRKVNGILKNSKTDIVTKKIGKDWVYLTVIDPSVRVSGSSPNPYNNLDAKAYCKILKPAGIKTVNIGYTEKRHITIYGDGSGELSNNHQKWPHFWAQHYVNCLGVDGMCVKITLQGGSYDCTESVVTSITKEGYRRVTVR